MAEEEEFSKLPLPDQFTHKNWKARKGGYEIATQEFKTAQPTDPIVREFIFESNLWKGAVGDSNVAAQQEALNAYNAFLDAAGTEGARRTRTSTVAPCVEKGLLGRPAAKAAALETLLLLIELDKADPIVEELLPFLSHKLPKIIAATLAALTAIYHAYGVKTVEPKPVIKLLPKVFGHADKNVRAEAQTLTVELYRWLREAMKPLFWNDLKEVQQKDLEKLFEPVKAEPTPKQERLLRSQQAAKEAAPAAAADGGAAEDDDEEAAEIDLEPEYEAVDVLSKIPKDFSDRLASTKWKDRKDVLDEVFALVNVPAIQEGSFDDIIRGCAKSMKDANIAVVTVAANCVECIAKGLRKAFSRYRSTILSAMLERLKEKKVSVTDAIGAACDAVFLSVGLADIQADVLEAMKNKNPQVKEISTKFLIRSLKATREAPSLEQTKEFAEAGKKLIGESSATLRDAGAEVMGVLWKIMGDRNMLNHLEGLDEIRKTKIKEFSDAAEVRAKWKPKAAPAPKAAPGAAKRPAPGARKVGAATPKRTGAPPPRAAASPTPAEDSRPASRPGIKPAGGLRAPGAGLKGPGGLQKPGGLKAPSSGTASPKRQGMILDDTPLAQAKSGLGRGLAGRPLGKPAAAPPSPPPAPRFDSVSSSALSSIERQELTDLRNELELLRNQNSDLRQDKMRLTSQISELQNQNAQLIEDHTRDVLQIKAKETQLVRARSDAESAEDRANSLTHEVERLKREMSRLGRGHMVHGGESRIEMSHERPSAHQSRSYGINSRTYANEAYGDDQGKENIPSGASYDGKLSGISAPVSHHRPMSHTSSGRATPNSMGGDEIGSNASLNRSGSDGGVESWRRAAEVTQNLKARIEMMKARQNSARGA